MVKITAALSVPHLQTQKKARSAGFDQWTSTFDQLSQSCLLTDDAHSSPGSREK